VPKSPYADRKGLGPGRRVAVRSLPGIDSLRSHSSFSLFSCSQRFRFNAQVKGLGESFSLLTLVLPHHQAYRDRDCSLRWSAKIPHTRLNLFGQPGSHLVSDHASEPGFREEFLHKYFRPQTDVIVAAGMPP